MILGASIYQVPLIKTAKKLGLYTIVASIPGEYPGFAIADKVYEINTTDKEAICRVCEEEQVDGICTTGTDVAVATIGYVCERLHLAGLSEHAAMLATDKAKMKEAFREGGVSASAFYRAESYEAGRQLRQPWDLDCKGAIAAARSLRQCTGAFPKAICARRGDARRYGDRRGRHGTKWLACFSGPA